MKKTKLLLESVINKSAARYIMQCDGGLGLAVTGWSRST